jgi:ribosomal protein L9
MSNESGGGGLNGPADIGVDAQFKTLADRVAKTADSDLKEFLSGILKATESTLTDMKFMQARLDKAQADADAAGAVAQKARKDASDVAVKAEIRAQAQVFGAVDAADVLPFISLSDVKVDENGKSNIAELLDGLKKAKPHLFGKVSTSATHQAPRPGNAGPRNALEMTLAEYRAAKARFTRR